MIEQHVVSSKSIRLQIRGQIGQQRRRTSRQMPGSSPR